MVGGHMSELVIRRGELKDVAGIVDVHCSELDGTWYSFKGGVRKEVEGPTSLSLYERWLNGGSWMSPELCAVYINNLLLEGHIPLVAEQNGLIVGELELFFGWESDGNLYAHIGVVQVHKDHQRKGIGALLIKEAINYARKRGAYYLTVRPREGLKDYYKNLGFGEWLKTVVFTAEASPYVARITWEEDNTYFNKKKFSRFIMGQEQSSAQIWQIFHRNQFALPEFTREPIHTGRASTDGQEILAIFYPHVYCGDMANVYAWSDTDIRAEHIWTLLTLAYHFGYARVRSLLIEEHFERLKSKLPLEEMERQEIFRIEL